jgi:FkbM family methyltransferase
MSDDVAAFGFYALPPAAERLRRLALALGPGGAARRARSALRRLVTLGRAGPFDVEPFAGQRARLYPAENLSDKRVFAAAELWDRAERAAIARALRAAGDPVFFVDAGANAGLYTLALRAEAGAGRIRTLAIEPDAENLARLRFNLRASGAEEDVAVAPVALSDRAGTIRMATAHGNRGESKADAGPHATGMPVAARPLLDLVREAGFPRIDALKIDIEGMELPVLRHYFVHAHRALWPRLVVIEARHGEETPALAHLRALGYETEERTRLNAVLQRAAAPTSGIGVTGNAHGNQA